MPVLKDFGWIHQGDEQIDLETWNKSRKKYWDDSRFAVLHPESFPNGLRCPKCGGMLYDTGILVSTSPDMMRVKCMVCTFKSVRYP